MAGPRGCRLCDKADNRRGIVSPHSHQNANNLLNLLKSVFGVPLAFLSVNLNRRAVCCKSTLMP